MCQHLPYALISTLCSPNGILVNFGVKYKNGMRSMLDKVDWVHFRDDTFRDVNMTREVRWTIGYIFTTGV